MDPGPGAFVYLHQMGLDPRNIDIVVLSHLHLDHSADVNVVIEAASEGGKNRRVVLVAPRTALEGEDRVVLPYIRKERVGAEYVLEEGTEIKHAGISIRAVMKHRHHGVETYALLFDNRVLYVSCALYEDKMLDMYPKNVDVTIINTTLYKKSKYVEHLSVEDAKKIIGSVRPKLAVLTHFGYEILKNMDPQAIASEVEESTGIRTVSAYDGMEVIF